MSFVVASADWSTRRKASSSDFELMLMLFFAATSCRISGVTVDLENQCPSDSFEVMAYFVPSAKATIDMSARRISVCLLKTVFRCTTTKTC